jgi:mRNA interferase MazF
MQQGDIWIADLEPPQGRRPVIILTRSAVIPHLTSITVIPVTTHIRTIPTQVRLTVADGVRRECAATADNIGTFHKRVFRHRVGTLSASKMYDIFRALRAAFDMPD